MHIQTVIYMYQ